MKGPAAWAMLLAAVTALSVLFTPAALGQGYETPTRKQWVRDADDICEEPYRKGNRLVDRFGELANRERWVPAGKLLVRLARIVFDVNDRVGALPRPPADADAIQTYLDGERRGAELFKQAGRKLKRKNVRRAGRLLDRSDRVVSRGQKAVEDFGLRECV